MDNIEFVVKALAIAKQVAKTAGGNKVKGIHPLYDISVKMKKEISYHSQKDEFPKDLFTYASPLATAEEIQYIENNYVQVTLPVFIDFLSTITRPFGDGNWSITYKEDIDAFIKMGKTLQQYLENEVPEYTSLESFSKFILPGIKTNDSMGFIGIRPHQIDYIINQDGQEVIDGTELFKPMPIYYESERVIDYVHKEYYLFLSKETCVTDDKKTGLIFELYLNGEVYLIKQVGVQNKYNFEAELFFSHVANEIPCIQMMGVPTIKDGRILWQSPFLYASDLLNLVLINANWLQASTKKIMYPHVVMLGDECDFTDKTGSPCMGGYVADGKGGKFICPTCSGTGLKNKLSPLGVLLVRPKGKFSEGELQSSQPPLQFISPEPKSLEFVENKIAKDESKARHILKLRTKNSTTTTQGDVTATEVADDAKSMTAFVKPISDQIFTIYEFIIKHIGIQRYEQKFQAPQLVYPKTFDFKNPEDYLKDISDAMTNNLPPSFIQTILMQYINAFYGDNAKTISIFILIAEADRLFGLTRNEINLALAKETAAKWEDILHSSAIYFVNSLLKTDANFFDKPLEKQVEAIQQMAKDEADKIAKQPIDALV